MLRKEIQVRRRTFIGLLPGAYLLGRYGLPQSAATLAEPPVLGFDFASSPAQFYLSIYQQSSGKLLATSALLDEGDGHYSATLPPVSEPGVVFAQIEDSAGDAWFGAVDRRVVMKCDILKYDLNFSIT